MARHLFMLLKLLSFVSIASFAQGEKVPVNVKETFEGQYPEAEEVAYKDNFINVKVMFTLHGEKMIANYTRKGEWKNSEKEWSFDKLSEQEKDGFQKSKYADWEVEETKIIYRAGGTERTRIKVKKSDIMKKYLFFNKGGQLIDEQITFKNN
jgi:hypothetical protein